jgi:nitrate reductase delta subunit
LAYPDEQTLRAVECCRSLLRAEAPAAAEWLDRIAEDTSKMTTSELQELYTQSFDLNPVCSLEVGWQLYGENYSRGEFLVEMRQTLRRLRVEETTELPDHLTHVLAAFGRMEEDEANRFGAEFLQPALEKMLQGLDGKSVPYVAVLEAIKSVVSCQLPVVSCQASVRKELPIVCLDDHETPTANWQLTTENWRSHG